EQLQSFPGNGIFEGGETGGVATRPRQALDVTGADRIGDNAEHDRNGMGCLQQWRCRCAGIGQDDVRRECDQFDRVLAHRVRLAVAPAIVDAEVLPDGPTQLLQALRKGRQTAMSFRIICSEWREHADAAHPLALLRARRERPRRRAAEKRDEPAAYHSITSSARASSDGGTSRPRALAVLRLIASSNLVGACTGRSAAFSPLRIRST